MKILGVSLGSRGGANDCMCREALLAAEKVGAEVSFIRLLDWNIINCTECGSCSRALTSGRGSICTIKDEFEAFWDILREADGVLFCSPVFEMGCSGLLHLVWHRFGPRIDRGMNTVANQIAKEHDGILMDQHLLNNKVVSFIGIPDWSVRIQCDHGMFALHPKWKVIDNERFPWSNNIILDDAKVARVREIGKNLVYAAADIENAKYTGAPGVCPHCHNNQFNFDCNSQLAICCLCGIEGNVVIIDGKVSFDLPPEQLQHANTLSGEISHSEYVKDMEIENVTSRRTGEYKKRDKYYKKSIKPIDPPSKRWIEKCFQYYIP